MPASASDVDEVARAVRRTRPSASSARGAAAPRAGRSARSRRGRRAGASPIVRSAKRAVGVQRAAISIAPSAGLHAVGHRAALEGRPGRAARGEDAAVARQHDLGVRADVDEHRGCRAAGRRGRRRRDRRRHRRRRGSRSAGRPRRAPCGCARTPSSCARCGQDRSSRGCPAISSSSRDRLVRALADRGDVEAEEEIAHRRVADHDDLVDLAAVDRLALVELAELPVERAARTALRSSPPPSASS